MPAKKTITEDLTTLVRRKIAEGVPGYGMQLVEPRPRKTSMTVDITKSPRYVNSVTYEVAVFSEGVLGGFIISAGWSYFLPSHSGSKTLAEARKLCKSAAAKKQVHRGCQVRIVKCVSTFVVEEE